MLGIVSPLSQDTMNGIIIIESLVPVERWSPLLQLLCPEYRLLSHPSSSEFPALAGGEQIVR